MITLLIAVALSQQQTISFTHPCANSTVVLAALGKELEVRMEPAGSVKQDYFLVSFHDVPADKALKEIADTLNATWNESGGVYYLNRTTANLNKEKREIADRLKERIEKYVEDNPVKPLPSIADLADRFRGFRDLDYDKTADRITAMTLDADAPPARAAKRIIAGFSGDYLAGLEPGTKIVFSRTPAPGVQTATRSMRAALDQMDKEYEIMAEAVSRAGLAGDKRLDYVSLRWLNRDITRDWDVRVELTRTETHVNVQLWKFVEDEHGRYTSSMGGAGVDAFDSEKPPEEMLRGLDVPLQAPETHWAIQSSFDLIARKTFAQMDSPAQAMLRDLPHEEPLSLIQSDAILQVAKIRNWNVVAIIDDLYFPAAPVIGKVKTPGQIMSTLLSRSVWTLKDGWFEARPKSPSKIRDERFDRAALSWSIAHAGSKDWLDLAAMANIALASNSKDHFWTQSMLLRSLFPTNMMFLREYQWLSLLGQLVQPKDIDSLPQEKVFRTDLMTAAQIAALRSVLSVSENLQYTKTIRRNNGVETHSGFVKTPLEYSNGRFPPGTVVRIKYSQRRAYFAMPVKIDTTTYISGPMSADNLAYYTTNKRDDRPGPDYSRLKILTTEDLHMTIELPEGDAQFDATTSAVGTGMPYLPIDKLPEQDQKEIAAAIKRYSHAYKIPPPRKKARNDDTITRNRTHPTTDDLIHPPLRQ